MRFERRRLLLLACVAVLTIVVYVTSYHSGGNILSIIEVANNDAQLITTILPVNDKEPMNPRLPVRCNERNEPHNKRGKSQLSYLQNMVEEYAPFHAEGIRRIKEGRLDSVRTLTWYCGKQYKCDGLGYRYQGLVGNLLIGILTKRVVLFRWSNISAINAFLVPNKIDWRYKDYNLETSSSFIDLGTFINHRKNAEVEKKFYDDMLRTAMSDTAHVQVHYTKLHQLLRDDIVSIYGARLASTTSTILQQILPFNSDIIEYVSFQFLFNFSEELELFTQELHSRMDALTHGAKYVAMHLRTGLIGNVHLDSGVRYAMTEESWKAAMDCTLNITNKTMGPGAVVMVVSDSVQAKYWIAENYPNVKMLSNKLVHIDRSRDIDQNALLGLWQDIIIMAEAHLIVHHQSTFSLLPAAICDTPASQISDYASCYK